MSVSGTIVEQGFNVIGIAIHTTNKAAMADGSIQKLWQRFFSESTFSKIPNKMDNSIVAVYYDFESDKSGEYNVLIGAKVLSTNNIPEGMVMQNVPGLKRTIFISESGPVSSIVFDLWKKIWALEDQKKLDRNYIADYELYDERCKDPHNGQVAIHIGVE